MEASGLFRDGVSGFLKVREVQNVRNCNRKLHLVWQPSMYARATFFYPFADNVDTKRVKRVRCRRDFNEPIPKLPPSLTQLFFGESFNQPIVIPPNVVHLIFGHNFNQPLENLPNSLLYLELGNTFNHPITALPPNLLHLTFGNNFNHPLTNLPESLTYLYLGADFDQVVAPPPSLRYIKAHANLELEDFTMVIPEITRSRIYLKK